MKESGRFRRKRTVSPQKQVFSQDFFSGNALSRIAAPAPERVLGMSGVFKNGRV
ncbi:MAG: hypothetical protein LBP19_01145 [Treponema sp.]|nr:hypothetical protein [Treponema sp.]